MTSFTSTSLETLRGMGYWLAYIRDPFASTTTAARTYMESGSAILISFALTVLCLSGLALVRWSHRRYAALLVACGIVLAVGVHPIWNSSPLMRPLAERSRSGIALALRSSTRALPVSSFGLALGIGALCTAVLDWSFREHVGFSAFVSIGSMLDVSWGDLIHYLGDDPNTRSESAIASRSA